ncbi:MAG: hypothetical protein MJ099_01410 [Clostridia bacterium]|nr:hypothetical protein [Clostridia bacterium]
MKRTIALCLALLLLFSAQAVTLPDVDTLETLFGVQGKIDRSGLLVFSSENGVTASVYADGNQIKAITVETEGSELSSEYYSYFDFPDKAYDGKKSIHFIEGNYHCWLLIGSIRYGFSVCTDDCLNEMVWQPIHGGKKRHSDPDCSDMDVPRLIPEWMIDGIGEDNVTNEGCKRCYEGTLGTIALENAA